MAEGIWQIHAEPAVPTVIGTAGSAFLYFQLKDFPVASLAKYKRLLGDLKKGWLHDDGEVKEVSIAGSAKFSANDIFDSDAEIVISYHPFPSE